MLAEIDPVQIVIIIIAMSAGFLQWLWGLFQQSRDERERRRAEPVNPEEKRLREEAWRRQVEASPQAPRPARDKPSDPWSQVRKALEEALETAQAPKPVAPPRPVRPAAPPPPPPRAVAPPSPVPPPSPSRPALAAAESFPESAPATVRRARREPLADLLARPASVRQAVLLREILGPPKALQTGPDAPV